MQQIVVALGEVDEGHVSRSQSYASKGADASVAWI